MLRAPIARFWVAAVGGHRQMFYGWAGRPGLGSPGRPACHVADWSIWNPSAGGPSLAARQVTGDERQGRRVSSAQ